MWSYLLSNVVIYSSSNVVNLKPNVVIYPAGDGPGSPTSARPVGSPLTIVDSWVDS